MKKYLSYIVVFFALFILIACGGGSDNIPNSGSSAGSADNPAVEFDAEEMKIKPDGSFTATVTFTKKVDSSYQLELNNFDFKTNNCSTKGDIHFHPESVALNGGEGDLYSTIISGKVGSDCGSKDTEYTFTATQKGIKNRKVNIQTSSITFTKSSLDNGNGVTTKPTSGFMNATTPLKITKPNTEYYIKVKVLENGYAIDGKVVRYKDFNDTYGTIIKSSAETGGDGSYAVFTYKSPSKDKFNSIDGESTIIQLTNDNNGTIITQDIVLEFNSLVDTSSYALMAIPDAINISKDDTDKTLELYLQDTKTKNFVANQEIIANGLNPRDGRLNKYTITTDEWGHASLTYTRPDYFKVGDPFSINFELTGGTVPKTATVNGTFVGAGFNYFLKYATNPILITHASQEKDISVYLVDSNNVGVPGQDLTIETIDRRYGEILSTATTTDSTGEGTFKYKAPDNLTNITGEATSVKIRFSENGTIITQDIVILISRDAISSDYSLINARPQVNINNSDQNETLDIQLIHTIEGKSIPVVDARPCELATNRVTKDCVMVGSIPRKAGRITDVTGSYEKDGYIYFGYSAPNFNELTSGTSQYNIPVYYIDENGEIRSHGTFSVEITKP